MKTFGKIILVVLFVTCLSNGESHAQVLEKTKADSLALAEQFKTPRITSPKKASIYSALFPGLGQIYNKKYWKLPLVYGGFAGLTYGYTWNNTQYQDYKNAYRLILKGDDLTQNDIDELNDFYSDPRIDYENPDHRALVEDQLERGKDYYRRNRDYNIIGMFALYVLNIIDASVDAHLSDFDVSDDLSMNVEGFANDKEMGVSLTIKF